jgi:hypothetical protein
MLLPLHLRTLQQRKGVLKIEEDVRYFQNIFLFDCAHLNAFRVPSLLIYLFFHQDQNTSSATVNLEAATALLE